MVRGKEGAEERRAGLREGTGKSGVVGGWVRRRGDVSPWDSACPDVKGVWGPRGGRSTPSELGCFRRLRPGKQWSEGVLWCNRVWGIGF